MKKNTLLATAALIGAMPVAFANTAAKTGTPAPPAPTPAATGAGSKPRTEPELTAVSTTVPMPVRVNNRGSKSKYPFDSLTVVGASFGVKNKTAKQLATIVSNANRKHVEPKKDEAGNVIYKMIDASDGKDGTIKVPSQEPETVQTIHFFVIDVDKTSDPDGATARIFRDK